MFLNITWYILNLVYKIVLGEQRFVADGYELIDSGEGAECLDVVELCWRAGSKGDADTAVCIGRGRGVAGRSGIQVWRSLERWRRKPPSPGACRHSRKSPVVSTPMRNSGVEDAHAVEIEAGRACGGEGVVNGASGAIGALRESGDGGVGAADDVDEANVAHVFKIEMFGFRQAAQIREVEGHSPADHGIFRQSRRLGVGSRMPKAGTGAVVREVLGKRTKCSPLLDTSTKASSRKKSLKAFPKTAKSGPVRSMMGRAIRRVREAASPKGNNVHDLGRRPVRAHGGVAPFFAEGLSGNNKLPPRGQPTPRKRRRCGKQRSNRVCPAGPGKGPDAAAKSG